MTWWQIYDQAEQGAVVRSARWRNAAATSGQTIVYVSGAGTTRAVAVLRSGGVDTVITPEYFGIAEFSADDWEVVS